MTASLRHSVQGFTDSIAPLLIAALVLAFGLAAVLISASGASPAATLTAMVRGAVGSPKAWANSINSATPLLFAALAVVVVFRAKLYAIGAEGQMYLGGLAGTLVAVYAPLPAVMLIPLCLVVAALAGAAWSLVPALAKVYRGTNEVMSTLLLNYIAIFIVGYLISPNGGPFHGEGFVFPSSAYIQSSARLPTIIPGTHADAGVVLGIALAVGLSVALARTTLGYQLRTLGDGRDAAVYAGHSVKRTVVVAMLISGAIAGLAVVIPVLAQYFVMSSQISPPPGWGYTGIAVALLAGLRPIPIIASALFFGALNAGSSAMQISTGLPASLGAIIQSSIILFVLAVPALQSLRVKRRERAAALAGYGVAPAASPVGGVPEDSGGGDASPPKSSSAVAAASSVTDGDAGE